MSAPFDLFGKRALITGAADAIGRACARNLASRGACVIVADGNAEAVECTADEVGGEAWVLDASNTGALESITLGVDILINNAGTRHRPAGAERGLLDFQRLIRTMMEIPYLLVRAALPQMRKHRWGRIINISADDQRQPQSFSTGFVSVAHGMEGLTTAVAREQAGYGVTCNCIHPTSVRHPQQTLFDLDVDDDDMHSDSGTVQSTVHTSHAETIASLVGQLIAPDQADPVNGTTYTVAVHGAPLPHELVAWGRAEQTLG